MSCIRVSRTVIKGLLVHLGLDVTTGSSSQECLPIVSHEHKVVFMDVCTSMDGYEAAMRINKKYKKHQDRPLIVALTGNTSKLVKENSMRVGMDGLILKPVSVDKMRGVLLELLEHGFYLKRFKQPDWLQIVRACVHTQMKLEVL
ncbi:hypothetical protein L6164_001182 [Bauhinia variegata]|uniref:Uncharacterized protein n=1 Tax=Bauhinia variegata TaxID=167791 RepID=A0ACB9Q8B1_BAUVA|nr:hypothetical protein L6164_001182 [Bauhinia variegata]